MFKKNYIHFLLHAPKPPQPHAQTFDASSLAPSQTIFLLERQHFNTKVGDKSTQTNHSFFLTFCPCNGPPSI